MKLPAGTVRAGHEPHASYVEERRLRLKHEARISELERALRNVPYAITMALQWTLVPSDVPEQMCESLRLHREMLAGVHDTACAALRCADDYKNRDD